jgi:hypothetical protein
VDIVAKKKRRDVAAAQFGEFSLACFAEVPRRYPTVMRPLVVLPRLESLAAGILRVLRIGHVANHARRDRLRLGQRPLT